MMKKTANHLISVFLLAFGLWVGFWGVALFKSFYKDFELTDFSYQRLMFPHVGGALLLAVAAYLIVRAFAKLKHSI